MRPLYLAAVVGTRFITVLALLILSHQMPANEFGIFTLVVTNALAMQMVFGSWLSSLATRLLVTETSRPASETLSGIAAAMSVVISLYAIYALGTSASPTGLRSHAAAVAALAASLLIYEVTLSVLNAAGLEMKYAIFALARNIGALICSVYLVWLGLGAEGAITGQIAGIFIALAFTPMTLHNWRKSRPSFAALTVFRGQIKLALAGSITLGMYIIVNAPVRNIVTKELGISVAGLWSLSGDLFYGPLNLLASAYVLSKLRLMYIDEQEGNHELLAYHSRQLINFAFALSIPYAIGGSLFAPSIARIVLPEGQRLYGAILAPYSAAQGSVILVLYCLSTLALVQKRLVELIIIAGLTAALPSISLFIWGGSIQNGATATLAALCVSVLVASGLAIRAELFFPDWREIGKVIAASLGLWIASACLRAIPAFPGSEIAAALLGIMFFVIISGLLRLEVALELVPSLFRWRSYPPAGKSLSE